MNLKEIFNVIGHLLILLAFILLIPLGVSLYYHQPAAPGYLGEYQAFGLTALLAGATGFLFWKFFPHGIESLREREGFVIVAFSWIILPLFGALPFLLTGVCPEFTNAYFESISGFTTTGATVLTHLADVPRGVLFWRSMTQWLGGMGIILLYLAIFPALGLGSFHLFRAEIPGGVTVERMRPQLVHSAKILWKIYVVLTLVETTLLWLGGMTVFDAICHTFATLSTGGFSPYDNSIEHFQSLYLQMVILVFMFLAGVSFALYFNLIHGYFKDIFQNPELRFYTASVLFFILLTAWSLGHAHPDQPTGVLLRKAAFTVVSLHTTTGFTVDDFNLWPTPLKVILLGLMMMGACSGSTCGSIKSIRILVLLRMIGREIKKLIHPQAVIHLKVGHKNVSPEHQSNAVTVTALFAAVGGLGFVSLTFMGLDAETAGSATFATLFNTGPGMGLVGPSGNYSVIPTPGKWLLILNMLMGRLEFFSILLLLVPLAWRK
jgi:trk/ktr system potassium uptake protein